MERLNVRRARVRWVTIRRVTMQRAMVMAVAIPALLVSATPAPWATAASAGWTTVPPIHYGLVAPLRMAGPGSLTHGSVIGHLAVASSFNPRTLAAPPLAGPAAPAVSCSDAPNSADAARDQVPAVADTTLATQTLKLLTSFPAMRALTQTNDYGADQAVQPPDTQLAAGPTSLLEMDNSTGSVWSMTGTLLARCDLNAFFPVPTGSGYSFTDPRILYDVPSGRFFASGLATDAASDSQVYVLVSQTNDPTQGWTPYLISANTTGVLEDQPKLGVCNDKVVVSWNDFQGTGPFFGQETIVLQKSDLLTAVPAAYAAFGPDPSRVSLAPSQSLSSTTTEYVVYNRNLATPASASIGVIALSGTPRTSNVEWDESDPAITVTKPEPKPLQPHGTIAKTDARFRSAVWQNGILWTGGNEGCTPTGDTVLRACMRLVKVSTATTPATVSENLDVGVLKAYVYYPAVMMDTHGNVIVADTFSSATTFASVGMTGVGATGTFSQTIVVPGTATYLGTRWGDYSSAARDVNSTTKVWLAAEYAVPDAAGLSHGINWATGIGAATVQ